MIGPLLEVQDVWLQYRDGTRAAEVLRGVSLQLAAGKSLGIMGPSGSGKSSLLLVLAGLRAPSRGVVRFGGVPWPANPGASADRRRRHVARRCCHPYGATPLVFDAKMLQYNAD